MKRSTHTSSTPPTKPWFQQIKVGQMENFAYLVGCPKTKECAVIDCGFEPDKILHTAKANGYEIRKIFLTHVHYDHSGAADELQKMTGAEIFMNPESEQKRGKNTLRGMWIIPEKSTAIKEGDTPKIGEIRGKVIHSPGHQSDHLLYIFGPYLFTGDTLFIGRVGRSDFPDSVPEEYPKTLNKIITLPENLIVCPGHDYGFVKTRILKEEKEENPYLQELINE
jgi:hydroxyacylglutathione hydrolase